MARTGKLRKLSLILLGADLDKVQPAFLCSRKQAQTPTHLAFDGAPMALGPWVTFDAKQERFVGEFADAANRLSRREDRKPFVVPEIV